MPLTAKEFLTNHTTIISPPKDEPDCSLCLETYNAATDPEPCVSITGIPGCSHAYGRNCLTQYLSSAKYGAYSCPICRTPWIENVENDLEDLEAQREDESLDARERREVARALLMVNYGLSVVLGLLVIYMFWSDRRWRESLDSERGA